MRSLLIISLLFLLSCNTEAPDKKALIDKYYNDKLKQLQSEKREECEQMVLNEAKARIDSLIDTWVRAELFDTVSFPTRPYKPLKPEAIIDKFQKFSLDSLKLD